MKDDCFERLVVIMARFFFFFKSDVVLSYVLTKSQAVHLSESITLLVWLLLCII